MEEINLRPAEPADIENIRALCVDSILNNCRKEYNPHQLQAWAEAAARPERWEQALKDQFFFLAEISSKLVGFASLENGSYIDFLFTAPGHERRGIASRLMAALVEENLRLKAAPLWANVSETARPFFERQGFRIEKRNDLKIQEVDIHNYTMIKNAE